MYQGDTSCPSRGCPSAVQADRAERPVGERLLASHYENNYGGAVRRLNAIPASSPPLDWAAAPGFALNGLKREELIAANSMILHEAYFDGLAAAPATQGALAEALERDFGSVPGGAPSSPPWARRWAAAPAGCCSPGRRGWQARERLGGRSHPHAGRRHVVLALDMYEHAYHIDFGAKVGAYVDAFMKNIAWERVAARFAGDRCRPPRAAH